MVDYRELQEKRLEEYIAAERAILTGQSYSIGDRSLTRANLKEVRDMIESLLVALSESELKRGRRKRVILID